MAAAAASVSLDPASVFLGTGQLRWRKKKSCRSPPTPQDLADAISRGGITLHSRWLSAKERLPPDRRQKVNNSIGICEFRICDSAGDIWPSFGRLELLPLSSGEEEAGEDKQQSFLRNMDGEAAAIKVSFSAGRRRIGAAAAEK